MQADSTDAAASSECAAIDEERVTRIEDEPRDVLVCGALGVIMAGAAVALLRYLWDSLHYDMQSPAFNPLGLLPPLLFAGGLFYVGTAAHRWVRHRRFGRSVLEFAGRGPRMGETFAGTVCSNCDFRAAPAFVFRLQYVETFRTRDQDASSHREIDDVRWEASQEVPRVQGVPALGVPFSFAVPGIPPRATLHTGPLQMKGLLVLNFGRRRVLTFNRPPDSTRWVLEMRAALPGMNYHVRFNIPADWPPPDPPDDDEDYLEGDDA